MRILIPSLVLACSFVQAADGTPIDPVRQQKAHDLMEVMHMRTQMQETASRIFTQQAGMFGQDMPAEYRAAFSEALKEVEGLLTKEIDYASLESASATAYAETFTAEELDQLIAFSKTPTGQKLATSTPALMARINGSSMDQIKTLMPRIQEIMTRHMSQVKPKGAPPKASSLKAGTPFPGFTGTTLDGKAFDFASLKGKVVLVDFWATWCGPCRTEMPHVKESYTKHHAEGLEVIGVSLDEDRDALSKFIADEQIPWTQLFDGKGWENAIAKQYKISSIPATYLIGRDGKVIASDLRGAALEAAIAAALTPAPAP